MFPRRFIWPILFTCCPTSGAESSFRSMSRRFRCAHWVKIQHRSFARSKTIVGPNLCTEQTVVPSLWNSVRFPSLPVYSIKESLSTETQRTQRLHSRSLFLRIPLMYGNKRKRAIRISQDRDAKDAVPVNVTPLRDDTLAASQAFIRQKI